MIHPDVQTLLDAGFRPLHVRHVIGVTRKTWWKWSRGLSKPNFEDDTKSARRLAAVAAVVRAALEESKLPFPQYLDGSPGRQKEYLIAILGPDYAQPITA